MKDDLKQKYFDVMDEEDWRFCILDNCVEISQYTTAGEDFFFAVDIENFVQNVIDYCHDFDPYEHVEMWVKARDSVSGVPNVEILLDDAKEIKENLMDLAAKLEKVK